MIRTVFLGALCGLATSCDAAGTNDGNIVGPATHAEPAPTRPLPPACIKGYAKRDAVSEAAASLKAGDIRFFTAFTDGAYRGYNVPAVDRCYDQKRLADRRYFRDVGNPSGGDGVHYAAEDKCESEALAFAKRYNRTIIQRAPQSLATNCGALAIVRPEK